MHTGNFLIEKGWFLTLICLVQGGTGITPMLQMIAAVLRNPTDKSKLSLLYANQTEDDILVSAEPAISGRKLLLPLSERLSWILICRIDGSPSLVRYYPIFSLRAFPGSVAPT